MSVVAPVTAGALLAALTCGAWSAQADSTNPCGDSSAPSGWTQASNWSDLSTAVGELGAGGVGESTLSVYLNASIIETGGDLAVPSGDSLTLDLCGQDLSITGTPEGDAAIGVPAGASLTVEDTSSTKLAVQGTLTADGGDGLEGGYAPAAGIGGDGGRATIKYLNTGAPVTATATPGQAAGTITIAGGHVDVNGGTEEGEDGGGGAGIGGGGGGAVEGYSKMGSTYGNYTATSGAGGGGGTVTVTGGNVQATGGGALTSVGFGGGGAGAGIGGGGGGLIFVIGNSTTDTTGSGGDGASFSASGSATVTASGGASELQPSGAGGAGIGGGGGGDAIVEGDPNTLSSGSGDGGSAATATVSGSASVTATGGDVANFDTGGSGAGIGGGGGGDVVSEALSTDNLPASAGVGGAGMSVGLSGDGRVSAVAGSVTGDSSLAGAGIGGGGGGYSENESASSDGAEGSLDVSGASGDVAALSGEVEALLTIDSGATLEVPASDTLTLDNGSDVNSGTVTLAGELLGGGTLDNTGAISISGAGSIPGDGLGGTGDLILNGNIYYVTFALPTGVSGTAPGAKWVYADTIKDGGETLPVVPARAGYNGVWTSGSAVVAAGTLLGPLSVSGPDGATVDLTAKYTPGKLTVKIVGAKNGKTYEKAPKLKCEAVLAAPGKASCKLSVKKKHVKHGYTETATASAKGPAGQKASAKLHFQVQ